MILSSCHHCSWNKWYTLLLWLWFWLYATSLCICHLVLSFLELTSITIVIIGMTLYELVIHYNNISYLMFFNLISSADFFYIRFYSILLYFKLVQFYSIQFCWIRFAILFSIVSHINEWFLSICPSVRSSVCLFISMKTFLFSLLLFCPFLINFFLTHPCTYPDTDTYIHMNIFSFLWLVHIT